MMVEEKNSQKTLEEKHITENNINNSIINYNFKEARKLVALGKEKYGEKEGQLQFNPNVWLHLISKWESYEETFNKGVKAFNEERYLHAKEFLQAI